MSPTSTAISLDDVRRALTRPLPGLAVQNRMAVIPRPFPPSGTDPYADCRPAAVLLLLYPGETGLCFVLTRRTDNLQSHQGQISMPGGSLDAGETPRQGALREAWEELAIDPMGVEILGELTRLYIPPSGFCIYPVVAYVPYRPTFIAAPAEVAEIIEEPLDHLLRADTCREEMWELRGQPTRVPFYAVGPHKVWGATAMVLCEFTALLTE